MYYYLHTYTAKCYYSHKKLELITMYVKLCNMIFFGKKEIIVALVVKSDICESTHVYSMMESVSRKKFSDFHL